MRERGRRKKGRDEGGREEGEREGRSEVKGEREKGKLLHTYMYMYMYFIFGSNPLHFVPFSWPVAFCLLFLLLQHDA